MTDYQSFAHSLAHLIGQSKDVVNIYTAPAKTLISRPNTTCIPSKMQFGLRPSPLNSGYFLPAQQNYTKRKKCFRENIKYLTTTLLLTAIQWLKCWLQRRTVRNSARGDGERTLFPETAQHRWSEGYWRTNEVLRVAELSAIFSTVRLPSASHEARQAVELHAFSTLSALFQNLDSSIKITLFMNPNC